VDAADCKKHGLNISADTVQWWAKQPKEVLEMLRKDNIPLQQALTNFSKWYGVKGMPTWGCGAGFDNVIIENAYKASWNETSLDTLVGSLVIEPLKK